MLAVPSPGSLRKVLQVFGQRAGPYGHLFSRLIRVGKFGRLHGCKNRKGDIDLGPGHENITR